MTVPTFLYYYEDYMSQYLRGFWKSAWYIVLYEFAKCEWIQLS